MTPVSRNARLFDLTALACILVGAGMCYVANTELTGISRYSYQHPGPPSVSQLTAADNARYTAYAGLAMVGIGIAVGVAGMLANARAKSRA